eukprot:m51a1_g4621 hypothetical protein (419) ;mRNA; f:297398-298832
MGLRPSLWLTVTTWPVVFVLAAGLAILVAMGVEWRMSATDMWDLTSAARQRQAVASIDAEVSFVRLAAEALPQSDPVLINRAIPEHSYDPTALLRLYNSLSVSKHGMNINSLGFYKPVPARGKTAKVQWQMATGFEQFCPSSAGYSYTFCASENATYPNFVCWCMTPAGVVNWNKPGYNNSDWGMSQEYVELAEGKIKELFLPVQPLHGKMLISYYRSFYANANDATPFAVTFAELFVQSFSKEIEEMRFLNDLGVVYVVEVDTQGMIASNEANGVSTTDGQRLFVHNSTRAVRDTYKAALACASPNGSGRDSVGDWLVGATIYSTDAGLKWLIVVLAPKDEVFHKVYKTIGIVAGVSAACLVVASGLWIPLMIWKVKRPMDVLRRGDKGEVYNLLQESVMFDEIASVAERDGSQAKA